MQRKGLAILLIIFLLGASLRIGYFFINSYNMDRYDDEPWSKINVARQWAYSPFLPIATTFAPLHTYIIATFLFMAPQHYILLSRILSLIFGILFILLYFYLLNELFDIKSAYLGTFLLAVYPLHINLSSVSLADMPACFFLFSSLYFLYRFIKGNKVYYLLISAVSLSLSCMLRYESWIFIFFFSLILFLRYKFSRYVFTFFALSCIFPILWLIYTYRASGDPLDFIRVSSLVNKMTMRNINLTNRIFGFILVLYKTMTLPIFACCSVGLGLTLLRMRNARNNIFIVLFPLLLIIYTIKSMQGTYDFTINRYSFMLGLLFIPFGGLTAGLFYKKIAKSLFLPIFILLCLIYSVKTMRLFYTETQPQADLISLVSWLKSNIKDNEKVLLECGNYHPFIMINANLKYFTQVIEYDHGKLELIGRKHLEKFIFNSDYIVVRKSIGLFKKAVDNIELSEKSQVVFDNEDWYILKLIK